MMTSLWESSRMRLWKTTGRLTDIRVGAREPEGLNYTSYSAFRPKSKQRGTLLGSPGFGEYHKTFHGAIRYETLTLTDPQGERQIIADVAAIKKFQQALFAGTDCTLYLLSGKSPGEATLIIAMTTENKQLDDIGGIGSLGEKLMSSFRRQLKIIAIPSILSIGLFCAMILPAVAGVVGPVVYVGFGLIAVFMLSMLVIVLLVLKSKLNVYPSRAVLAGILQQEGFTRSAF